MPRDDSSSAHLPSPPLHPPQYLLDNNIHHPNSDHNPHQIHNDYNNHDDDDDDDENVAIFPSQPIEAFEIDDGWLDLSAASSKWTLICSLIRSWLISPATTLWSAIASASTFAIARVDALTTRIGNPLVINRIAYVLFISVVMYSISLLQLNDGVDGVTGGGFSAGKFYDTLTLGASISHYIDRKQMKLNLEYLSHMPNVAGSHGDYALSSFVERFMHLNGIKGVSLQKFNSFLNYPSDNTYLKLADDSFHATLHESEDKIISAFCPGSVNSDGEIHDPYVYAHYGAPADYSILEDAKILVKNCIVLIHQGGGPDLASTFPEANKVAWAHEHGAKAVVLISPKVKINSTMRDDVIQRVSVGDFRNSPGNVLSTPLVLGQDLKFAKESSQLTSRIPAIPISYRDGAALLQKLGKAGAQFHDGSFSGNDSSHSIKLKVSNVERKHQAAWNVEGVIEGREQAQMGLVIGASRDSSCRGTIASHTGTVVLLELIRVFASLQRQYNWSPSRSIHFVSFDATHNNAAGVADYVLRNRHRLQGEAVAYIDLSDAVLGDTLDITANPLLHSVIKNALETVKSDLAPFVGQPLAHMFRQQHTSDSYATNFMELKNYVPFINLLNVPSLEIKFSGEQYPKDSCLDNFQNFEASRIDPLMHKHAQLTNLLALIVLELAEAPVIPYRYTLFFPHLIDGLNDLVAYTVAMTNRVKLVKKPNVHYKGLAQALQIFKTACVDHFSWTEMWKHFVVESDGVEPSLLAMARWELNEKMTHSNCDFLDTSDMPLRSAYINLLLGVQYLAPGVPDNSRQWSTFPLIRDALDRLDFDRAQQLVNSLTQALQHAAKGITLK